MLTRHFAGVLSLALVTGVHAGPIQRISTPGISPDGSTIAFSWQNDIWTVPVKGGLATRITVHPATDSMPRWMPNGRQIAFISNRYGSNDVFVMNSDGTDLKRLSFESSTEFLYSTTSDQLYGYSTGWGRANLFQLRATGGDIVRLSTHPFEMQYFPSVSPDGTRVVYCLGGSGGNWRNPKEGGTDTSEIWVGKVGAPVSDNKQLTKNDHNDIFPNWGKDGQIYFVSNRSGSPQLWTMDASGRNAKQITQHDGGTVRWANIGDSDTVVYEYDGQLWHYDTKRKRGGEVVVMAPDDSIENPFIDVTVNADARDYALSPDGKRAIIAARGDLFLIPGGGGTTRRLTTSLAPDTSPVWLDNRRVLYVNGAGDKRELWVTDIDGKATRFAAHSDDLTNPVISPDRKWIAVHIGDKGIGMVSAEGGSVKQVATGAFWSTYQGGPRFSWSPDSEWLAYSTTTERGANVFVLKTQTGRSVQIARVAQDSGTPYFSADAKAVFFDSEAYGGSDIDVVDLVEPPLTFSEDDLDQIDAEKPKPDEVKVVIDERGIMNRLRRITSDGVSVLGPTADGKSIYVRTDSGPATLSLRGGAPQPIASLAGQQVTKMALSSGKAVFLVNGKPIQLVGDRAVPVNFSAQFTVNRKEEEKSLFNEIWWAMSRMYYDPGMHGLNWKKIQAEYAAKVPYAFDRTDFYALMNEMIEELDSSHLSIGGPPSSVSLPNEDTATLGIEWDWAEMLQRKYVVGRVYAGGPADSSRQLLLAGDEIVTVDGESPAASSMAELLRNKAGRKVRLAIKRKGIPLVIDFKPGRRATLSGLVYEQFITDRRAEAEKLSNGAVTYFHIQGMNGPSTDRFMRDARVYGEGKKGSVVDVRWNGGGNTANRMLASLRLMPWLVRTFRWMPEIKISEEMFRGQAIEMPTVLMTNQYSASNAEIFSEGFRRMKIGPVVGEATGGNVLTVSGRYPLWDGGGVQIPFIGIYTVDGESLEGIGRKVDYDVRFDPNAWNEGRDNQLEVAVKALLRR